MTLNTDNESAVINSAEATILVPTPLDKERAERKKKLKRFNMLYLYLPLGLVTVLSLIVFGWLFWVTIFGDGAIQRGTGSGISDIWIILTCLAPLALIAAIFPLAGVFLLYKRRQRGSIVREPLQRVLRKADNAVVTVDGKVQDIQPKVGEKVVAVRGKLAYIASLFRQLQNAILELFTRTLK